MRRFGVDYGTALSPLWPCRRSDMAYFGFTDKLRSGKKIQIFNHGNCQRDFTYVDDIVEGIIRVMNKPPERRRDANGIPATPPVSKTK